MTKKLMLHEYLGKPVVVTTGAITQFAGTIIGFGSTQEGGLTVPRTLVHVEDANGETGWFELGELTVGGDPLAVKKPVGQSLDELELFCEREIVECDKKRRTSTTAGAIRTALGGRRTALAEIRDMVRNLRAEYTPRAGE